MISKNCQRNLDRPGVAAEEGLDMVAVRMTRRTVGPDQEPRCGRSSDVRRDRVRGCGPPHPRPQAGGRPGSREGLGDGHPSRRLDGERDSPALGSRLQHAAGAPGLERVDRVVPSAGLHHRDLGKRQGAAPDEHSGRTGRGHLPAQCGSSRRVMQLCTLHRHLRRHRSHRGSLEFYPRDDQMDRRRVPPSKTRSSGGNSTGFACNFLSSTFLGSSRLGVKVSDPSSRQADT